MTERLNDRERELYEGAIRAKETAIRALLAEVRRLKAENGRLRQGRLAGIEAVKEAARREKVWGRVLDNAEHRN